MNFEEELKAIQSQCKQVDFVYKTLDDAKLNNNHEFIEDVLANINIEGLPVAVLFSILTVTQAKTDMMSMVFTTANDIGLGRKSSFQRYDNYLPFLDRVYEYVLTNFGEQEANMILRWKKDK